MKIPILLFAFFISALAVLGSVSAECDYSLSQPLKQNQGGDLPQTCTYANCTYVNITSLRYPNQTEITTNWAMTTSNSVNYIYQLSSNYTSSLGSYVYTTCGNPAGVKKCTSICFEVTSHGISNTESRTNAISRSIYLVFAIAILLFMTFLFYETSLPVRLTFAVLSFLFIIIGLNLVVITLADEIVNPNVQSFFDSFTAISFYMYWFLGGFMFLMWIYTFYNTWIYKKNQEHARRFGEA